jgi:effector-binding domain-containing protein
MSRPAISFTVAPKVVVASLERRGAYSGVGEAMKELKEWVDSKGVKQIGKTFCMFFDNPSETPEPMLRSEVCIPVTRVFEGEGKFRVRELAETQVAETHHRGSPERFALTYGPFLETLVKGGYRLLGPAREYYMDYSDVTGPGAGFLIQQPIAKK